MIIQRSNSRAKRYINECTYATILHEARRVQPVAKVDKPKLTREQFHKLFAKECRA